MEEGNIDGGFNIDSSTVFALYEVTKKTVAVLLRRPLQLLCSAKLNNFIIINLFI